MEKLNEDAETRRAVGTCKDRRDCAFRVNFALILCEILTNMHLPFFRQKLEIFRTGRKIANLSTYIDCFTLAKQSQAECRYISLEPFSQQKTSKIDNFQLDQSCRTK